MSTCCQSTNFQGLQAQVSKHLRSRWHQVQQASNQPQATDRDGQPLPHGDLLQHEGVASTRVAQFCERLKHDSRSQVAVENMIASIARPTYCGVALTHCSAPFSLHPRWHQFLSIKTTLRGLAGSVSLLALLTRIRSSIMSQGHCLQTALMRFYARATPPSCRVFRLVSLFWTRLWICLFRGLVSVRWRPCFEGFPTFKNRGHSQGPGIYVRNSHEYLGPPTPVFFSVMFSSVYGCFQ